MHRQYALTLDHKTGFIETQMFFFHEVSDSLQQCEGGMTLIEVKHRRLNPQGVQGATSTNSQKDLLPYSHFIVAAIESGSDRTHFGRIFGNVGVEEVKGYPAHIDFQYPEIKWFACQIDGEYYGGAC